MINESVYDYCAELSSGESEVLKEIRRQTFLRTIRPQMLSGPLQGQMLRLLVTLFKVETVLEIGTFTGYATICLAEGLPSFGKVHTIEWSEELSWFHKKFFPQSGLADKIITYYGDANMIIPELDVKFDLVFMDAGKKDYKSQLDTLQTKLNPGGIILADNVLWKEKVVEDESKHDKITKQIHDFNKYVKEHKGFDNVVLPIRDGINLIVKQ